MYVCMVSIWSTHHEFVACSWGLRSTLEETTKFLRDTIPFIWCSTTTSISVCAGMHTYIPSDPCVLTLYIHTYIHTIWFMCPNVIHTYIHTYIQYIHVFILQAYTYIHTFIANLHVHTYNYSQERQPIGRSTCSTTWRRTRRRKCRTSKMLPCHTITSACWR